MLWNDIRYCKKKNRKIPPNPQTPLYPPPATIANSRVLLQIHTLFPWWRYGSGSAQKRHRIAKIGTTKIVPISGPIKGHKATLKKVVRSRVDTIFMPIRPTASLSSINLFYVLSFQWNYRSNCSTILWHSSWALANIIRDSTASAQLCANSPLERHHGNEVSEKVKDTYHFLCQSSQ